MSNKYAIIDIETTGGLPKRDRITEIAIVLSDGKKIIDQYETLLDPGVSIPPNITRITGITNEMVKGEPRFFQVAKKIVEMTEGAIFVAHNVQFDYGFIQNKFASLGYSFSKRRLCTVRMSRKAFPGLKSYALGNLIRHFDISVNNRHRALDDALATTIIFHKILASNAELVEKQFVRNAIDEGKLPEGITKEFVESLPTLCGVYYMSDGDKDIVYIGKSINIRKRIKQHFAKVDKKTNKFLKKVRSIHFELTGNELIALLKEAREIKEMNPEINIALRRKDYPYCVYIRKNDEGYLSVRSGKVTDRIEKEFKLLSRHSSSYSARSTVIKITDAFALCKQINKIEKSSADGNPCFDHTVGKCLGACVGIESSDSYNDRVEESILMDDDIETANFIILEPGRTQGEKSVILIQEGNYRGYGYISEEDSYFGVEELMECVELVDIDKQYNRIVNNHLRSNPVEKIIEF